MNYGSIFVQRSDSLRIQSVELSEVAELKWDGASELIRGMVPERDNRGMRTRIDEE